MNDHPTHDADLVAALAGGWIDDASERASAEVLVEECDACRTEFELHTGVSGWLASAADVPMTADERDVLHRRVRAEVAPGANVVAMPDRSTRTWLRIGSVAAALVVVVGVGGLLTQLDGAQSGDSAGAGSAETLAADEAADPVEELLRDDSGGEAATAMQTEETASAAAESAEDMDEAVPDGSIAGYGGPLAAPVVEDATDHSPDALAERAVAFTEEVASREDPPPLTPDDFSAREAPTPECFTTAVEPAYGALLTTLEDRPIQVYVVADDSGALSPLVLRPDDACSVVELP